MGVTCPSGCDRVNVFEYLGKTAVLPVLSLITPLQYCQLGYGVSNSYTKLARYHQQNEWSFKFPKCVLFRSIFTLPKTRDGLEKLGPIFVGLAQYRFTDIQKFS